MGVRVFTRQWSNNNDESEIMHFYEKADNWNLLKVGEESVFLEVTKGDERVLAAFSQFNRVEAVDPPEDEDDGDED